MNAIGRVKSLAGGGLVALLAIVLLTSAAVAAEGLPPGQKTTFDEVANAIMSPVCKGKLLANCPSAEGAQLRELVRRKVYAGETKEQIVKYFVDVYGPEVLPEPPSKGFLITSWLLPAVALISGFGVALVLLWAWTQKTRTTVRKGPAPETAAASSEAEDPLAKRLHRELDQFDS